ncbi:MAG: Eco57I restriction-modification methylase domain-containing protein [Anaerolineaceae bacterium]
MQTRNRHAFTTIHTEGALLPVDLLQRVRANDSSLVGLTPESYHLAPGEKLNEAINRSWNRLNGLWGAFQTARGRLSANDAGNTLTRERWLLPLFQELGFGRLATARAIDIEGKSYPISHRWENVPLHLVGCGLELDKRAPGVAGAARVSPHSLLQEYLNRADDAQWGIVANGLSLRVLRDNAALTRQAYIEFDLESLFDGEVYSDFVLLWLVCHQSRFEPYKPPAKGEASEGKQDGGECILERWSKSAQESGTRALDDLRRGVEEAIVSFGQGFLLHPLNGGLRSRLKKGNLSAQDYYRQLLRLVYRLIFLFAAEDRELLLLPEAPVEARQRYQRYYSTARLRSLAERQRGSRHYDRYEALRLVMNLLGSDEGNADLAIPALGGFLFDANSMADLDQAKLDNQSLLSAVRSLAFITEGNIRRAVDYRNLGPEELGSVYESLLELHPLLNTDAGTFQLTSAAGNERKTTGSYYTHSSLIQVLLDSALDPVIDDRVGAHRDLPELEDALLSLKVCDPACGSGHFLIAAAHRIAGRLAMVRARGDEPSPNETRRALRDVIRHCIYGVDVNPMAVELCKVNLWLESLEPGKPLSFLDAHIKCGNSLVGVGPKMDLDDLVVPDGAFNPVTGDHKPTATLLKKRNKQEREGQESLFVTVITTREDLERWLTERTRALEAMPEDSAEEVQAKAAAYQQVNESDEYIRQRQIADLWTAAFYWKIEEPESTTHEIVAPTHGQLRRLRDGLQIQNGLQENVDRLRQSENFFHWPLEFVEVAAIGGFDCVLGNPPWEKIQAEEQVFFATRDINISSAVGIKRKNMIGGLQKNNPDLYKDFEQYKKSVEVIDTFIKISNRFPLTGSGKMNTYAVFAELGISVLSVKGHTGFILPLGIVTDENNKEFFAGLVRSKSLISVFGFENEEFLFRDVHHAFKFVCLTMTGAEFNPTKINFAFYCRQVSHLFDKRRGYTLALSDVLSMNPNTITSPIFRTFIDAELNAKIYSKFPVITNDVNGTNPWNVSIHRMVNPTDDSSLFKSKEELQNLGGQLIGNHFFLNDVIYMPVYEAKMIHQFDHRFGTYENQTGPQANQGKLPELDDIQHAKPDLLPLSRYWMEKKYAEEWISRHTTREWLFAFRDITSSVVLSTAIAAVIPRTATVDPCRVIYFEEGETIPVKLLACFIGSFNSLVFDYLARQKVSGSHLAIFILKQLPVLPPKIFSSADIEFLSPRVLELAFTAYDLKPFAEEMGYHGEPFRWNDERRALLRAELDAYYAALYGLTRDELRYILVPKDVYGPDFPGETFRVLKEKEIKQFGEYRTRRLVLEAWDRLEKEETIVAVTQSLRPTSKVPFKVEIHRQVPDIVWIPVNPVYREERVQTFSAIHRQALGVAWLLNNFGTGKSISKFDSQKYCYFVQRKGIADLDITYREFARGPYSPEVTYKSGLHAKKKNYWEVVGNNVTRRRNINEAINGANQVITNINDAKQLIKRLSELSKDDLGGIATVDFTGRALFGRGQPITPDTIRAYFESDWLEKVEDAWYTNENIDMAFKLLEDIGLFEKSVPTALKEETSHISLPQQQIMPAPSPDLIGPSAKPPVPVKNETETLSDQPTLTDFGLYKCGTCGKMVMGYEKGNHEREKHAGKPVEWKKMK